MCGGGDGASLGDVFAYAFGDQLFGVVQESLKSDITNAHRLRRQGAKYTVV